VIAHGGTFLHIVNGQLMAVRCKIILDATHLTKLQRAAASHTTDLERRDFSTGRDTAASDSKS
jgi:hypothetical protein